MKANEKLIIGAIAVFAGLIGGVLSRCVLPKIGEKRFNGAQLCTLTKEWNREKGVDEDI
jgi:hypothetical protein